jgi:hypothetical protein
MPIAILMPTIKKEQQGQDDANEASVESKYNSLIVTVC